jgi:hypothetical protein
VHKKHRYTKKELIKDWMLFFLSDLEIVVVCFEKKYELFKETGGYSSRQKKIVAFVKKAQPVKISDI